MAAGRNGMCELARHGMAGERNGNGIETAWDRHGMRELALRVVESVLLCDVRRPRNTSW
jgi:hypothetical protein